MDITDIPMARGFVYLAVALDGLSRRVLSWRLSITMEAAFCVETLEDALARHGKPDIFNTDQGCSSRARRSPACSTTRHCDQHGRERSLARQCLRRAAVALLKYEEVISEGLRQCQRGPLFYWQNLTSTMAGDRIEP